MKTTNLLILVLFFFSCQAKQTKPKEIVLDNIELIEIYENDQSDRKSDQINWSLVSKRDSIRRKRVYELLDSNKVNTSNDYQNAAMVFQHGGDTTSYAMAVKLMKKSIELDSIANKWLLAAATDRYLLSKGEPQIYGTQYQKKRGEPWRLGKIDTTKISDEERIKFGVETLAEQREKVRQMNLTKLSELQKEGKSIDEIVQFVKTQRLNNSEYDISERGLNIFGYNLIYEGKNKDALKILELNTILYPNGFNTFDSYGECLDLLGRTNEAINAYKKSLELNPKNEHAITELKRLQKKLQ